MITHIVDLEASGAGGKQYPQQVEFWMQYGFYIRRNGENEEPMKHVGNV